MRSLLFGVTIAAIAACAEADGEVKGGELTALGAIAVTEGPFDAPLPEIPNVGSGATWADLYRDVFGPEGTPSCVRQGACHGAGGSKGAQTSGPMCIDEAGCETEFTSKWGAIAPALRRRKDGVTRGSMPQQPVGVFSATTLDRIRTWAASRTPPLDTTAL